MTYCLQALYLYEGLDAKVRVAGPGVGSKALCRREGDRVRRSWIQKQPRLMGWGYDCRNFSNGAEI